LSDIISTLIVKHERLQLKINRIPVNSEKSNFIQGAI